MAHFTLAVLRWYKQNAAFNHCWRQTSIHFLSRLPGGMKESIYIYYIYRYITTYIQEMYWSRNLVCELSVPIITAC